MFFVKVNKKVAFFNHIILVLIPNGFFRAPYVTYFEKYEHNGCGLQVPLAQITPAVSAFVHLGLSQQCDGQSVILASEPSQITPSIRLGLLP